MVKGNKKKQKNRRNHKKGKVKEAKRSLQSHKSKKLEILDDQESEVQRDSMQSETETKSIKRKPEDSDIEDKPKKKKRKTQTVAADSTEKKGKKSIRQTKKEKFLQRQADAEALAKDQLKSQCLNYLSQWKHNRQNWKFMKAKQVWLYKNKFSTHLIPDSSWPTLLEYFESAMGNIKNMLLEDANKVIKQMDVWTESQNSNSEKDEAKTKESDTTLENIKPDDTTYKRARDLIQCLQE